MVFGFFFQAVILQWKKHFVTVSAPIIAVPLLFSMFLYKSATQVKSLPASIPTADPIAACRQMSGEEINKAIRKMPPVQGLSQP